MHSSIPLSSIAIIIILMAVNIRRRKLYEAFRVKSATSPEYAATLSGLGIRDSILLGNQVRQKIIVSSPDDRYYLAENRLAVTLRFRRKIAFVLGAGLFIFAFVMFLNR